MRKFLAITYILSLSLGCSKDAPDLLSEFVNTELAKNTGVIDLRYFNKIKWDKLYVLCPYTTSVNFDKNLLKYADQIEDTGIKYLDDFSLLLLFDKDELVSFSKVSTNLITFSYGSRKKGVTDVPYDKADSFFRSCIAKGGHKWILERNRECTDIDSLDLPPK